MVYSTGKENTLPPIALSQEWSAEQMKVQGNIKRAPKTFVVYNKSQSLMSTATASIQANRSSEHSKRHRSKIPANLHFQILWGFPASHEAPQWIVQASYIPHCIHNLLNPVGGQRDIIFTIWMQNQYHLSPMTLETQSLGKASGENEQAGRHLNAFRSGMLRPPSLWARSSPWHHVIWPTGLPTDSLDWAHRAVRGPIPVWDGAGPESLILICGAGWKYYGTLGPIPGAQGPIQPANHTCRPHLAFRAKKVECHWSRRKQIKGTTK